MKEIDFFKHNLDEEDIKNVVDVLHGIFLTMGDVVKKFEEKFAKYVDAKHAISVNSCTAALHLSLLAAGIEKDDEVITTPLSFIATANAIEYVGAKPVFVDVEKETGNINVVNIEKAITKKTKAIIPVHLYGLLCDMPKIRKIADKHSLVVIEDAAHAIESRRENYRAGTFADFTCYSFYATKNLTSGEGGMITTPHDNLAEVLYKSRLHGMSKNAADRYTKKYEHYDMEFLGWKYNMTNINAAMMIHQIDLLEERLRRRELLCQKYEKAFSEISNINLLKVYKAAKSARHLFTILVDKEKRDDVLKKIQDNGIGVAINFRVIHLMKYYREKYGYKKGDFPIAENIGDRTITLPLYPKLSNSDQTHIINVVKDILR